MKIADSELEIMRILWREARPLSYAEIRTELEKATDWKKSTIQTLLSRLKEKGAIDATQNYVTLYNANITQDEYVKTEGRNFINKLFDGSAKSLVASLCQNGQLDERDIDELKAFFRVNEGGENQ